MPRKEPPPRFFKITVSFESRGDGGLRAWSDDVPGFVLSHRDASALIADIKPALDVILSARLGEEVTTEPLGNVRAMLEDSGLVIPEVPFASIREYVALRA